MTHMLDGCHYDIEWKGLFVINLMIAFEWIQEKKNDYYANKCNRQVDTT